MKKYLSIACLLTGSFLNGSAQDFYVLNAVVIGNDTIPSTQLREVTIITKRQFDNPIEAYRFNKLRRDVITVYPYAQKVVNTLEVMNENLSKIKRKRDKKRYLRNFEKEIKSNFKKPLKNLTVTQGKILVKIIQRETGESCYDLIKEYKTSISAYFWQRLGSVLGYDLKVQFDPVIDKDIEIILRSIENS